MNVNYMATGVGGTVTQETATISVGGATGYADTVQGMISAINNANLGLTASFGTASQAGKQAVAAGASSDTGILISGTGAGVGSGATPGAIGTLASTGAAGDGLTGTLTVKDSTGVAHTITLGTPGTTDNLSDLANTLNVGRVRDYGGVQCGQQGRRVYVSEFDRQHYGNQSCGFDDACRCADVHRGSRVLFGGRYELG